jgi:hypothetical protein
LTYFIWLAIFPYIPIKWLLAPHGSQIEVWHPSDTDASLQRVGGSDMGGDHGLSPRKMLGLWEDGVI